jgi:putative FmdB family regulatory protein
MPIYEFKCLECSDIFELLIMKSDNSVDMRCPKCGSETFERVMSTACFAVSGSPGSNPTVKTESRTCSGGSCSTIEVPGPTR